MVGRVFTILTRMEFDSKRFRAGMKKAARELVVDFKRSVSIASAAVGTLTLGLATARRAYVRVTDASALAARTFGKSVDDIADRARKLASVGIGKDAEETANAFDLLARLGADSADEAQGLLPMYQRLADALGVDLLAAINSVGGDLVAMRQPLGD